MLPSECTESSTFLHLVILMKRLKLLCANLLGSHFFKAYAEVPNAKLECLCVFFLSFWVTLQQLHKTAYVQHFFVLPVHLYRYCLYFVLKTQCIGTCLCHTLKLHLKKCHVSRAILGQLNVTRDFVNCYSWSIFRSSGIRRVRWVDCVRRQHLGRHGRYRESGLIYMNRSFCGRVTSYWRDVPRHFKL